MQANLNLLFQQSEYFYDYFIYFTLLPHHGPMIVIADTTNIVHKVVREILCPFSTIFSLKQGQNLVALSI